MIFRGRIHQYKEKDHTPSFSKVGQDRGVNSAAVSLIILLFSRH
jgi:hypothetical protein